MKKRSNNASTENLSSAKLDLNAKSESFLSNETPQEVQKQFSSVANISTPVIDLGTTNMPAPVIGIDLGTTNMPAPVIGIDLGTTNMPVPVIGIDLGSTNMPAPVIGIDLGTTKCCVAAVLNNRVQILENEQGNKTTPSYVAFNETEWLVGEKAKDQSAMNCANTVFSVKTIIGNDYMELMKLKDHYHWPFCFAENNGRPLIEVQYRGKKLLLHPELITAMLLTKMKQIAESHLKCPVEAAVISVPGNFNNAQRQATKDAAEIAGLKVLELINEPTSAAIAYYDNRADGKPQTGMIFDCGGGFLDISIVQTDKFGVKVKSATTTSEINGVGLDSIIAEIVLEKFHAEIREKFKSSRSFERLRCKCNEIKHSLSLLPESNFFIDDVESSNSIQRSTFEQKFSSNFAKLLNKLLEDVLSAADIKKEQIDSVVLVGGSSRIPTIQQALSDYFRPDILNYSVNADEAVAHGAAYLASVISEGKQAQGIQVYDVRNSLEMDFLESKLYHHRVIDQTRVLENGGNVVVLDNCGIFYQRKDVMTEYDHTKCRTLLANKGLNDSERKEIELMMGKFQEDAKQLLKCDAAMNDLESFCFKFLALVKKSSSEINSNRKTLLQDSCNEILIWLDENNSASLNDYEMKKNILISICRSNVDVLPGLRKLEVSFNQTINGEENVSGDASVMNDSVQIPQNLGIGGENSDVCFDSDVVPANRPNYNILRRANQCSDTVGPSLPSSLHNTEDRGVSSLHNTEDRGVASSKLSTNNRGVASSQHNENDRCVCSSLCNKSYVFCVDSPQYYTELGVSPSQSSIKHDVESDSSEDEPCFIKRWFLDFFH